MYYYYYLLYLLYLPYLLLLLALLLLLLLLPLILFEAVYAINKPITGQCIAEHFPTTFHLHARLSLGDSKLANPVDALLEAVYASRMPKRTFINLTTDVK